MISQFSRNGKYFAQLSADSKLKIWETSGGTFEQEFTPDFHLTTPCTCLHFVQPGTTSTASQNHSPRKKKRKEPSSELTIPYVALGTSSGLLLLYSISKAGLEFMIDSKTSQSIGSISWEEGNVLFSTVDQNVVSWNLDKRNVRSKWKGGNERLTSVLAVPGNDRVLTAAKNIKLWDVDSKEMLRTFVGHANGTHILRYVNPRSNDTYIISGSKGDRLLSVWNLKGDPQDNGYVASFLMEDVPSDVSVRTDNGGSSFAVVTRNGVVHFYRHTLNGKCGKPIKPKTTIQVASDASQSDGLVAPIPIVGVVLRDELSVGIAHGNDVALTFENVALNEYEKVQCLIRRDPRATIEIKEKVTKVRTPVVDNDVHYLTPHTSTATSKRKVDGKNEVPMEKRLENLMLNKSDGKSKVPKVDNVAQLLVQGLHSKDKAILRSVLHRHDETVIRNTVKRLPMPVVVPFVHVITGLIQGKTVSGQTGSLWLKHLLQVHAGILLSNSELPDLLGPVLGTIESRLSLLIPLNRLRGRLDLLISQASAATNGKSAAEETEDGGALLIYNDKGTSESEDEDVEIAPQFESDNEWIEEDSSEDEGENNEQDDESDSDLKML